MLQIIAHLAAANSHNRMFCVLRPDLRAHFASETTVPSKKKPKPFRAVTAVKELARERVGTPPAEKIVVEKKKKPVKHKPTLGKLLNDPE